MPFLAHRHTVTTETSYSFATFLTRTFAESGKASKSESAALIGAGSGEVFLAREASHVGVQERERLGKTHFPDGPGYGVDSRCLP